MKPRRPLPADFAEHVTTKTIKGLMVHYRAGADAVTRWVQEFGGRDAVRESQLRPVPDDFAEHAVHEVNRELLKRYACSTKTLFRWRRETGIVSRASRPTGSNRTEIPDGFAISAPAMTRTELRVRYGRSKETINRWCKVLGVSPAVAERRPPQCVGAASRRFSPTNGTAGRDMSRVGQAVDFLRKYGPVVRCDVAGRYDPKGDRWRRGSTILSAPEIVERAERLGFDADAWKRVA